MLQTSSGFSAKRLLLLLLLCVCGVHPVRRGMKHSIEMYIIYAICIHQIQYCKNDYYDDGGDNDHINTPAKTDVERLRTAVTAQTVPALLHTDFHTTPKNICRDGRQFKLNSSIYNTRTFIFIGVFICVLLYSYIFEPKRTEFTLHSYNTCNIII